MIVARGVAELRRARAEIEGESVAFVPTMGFLHAGHLSLVRAAVDRADHVIVSIFVNPLQFGSGEDLARYPRDEESDIEKLRAEGVHTAFLPTVPALYPPGFATRVQVRGPLAERLCGAARPGHFDGVATVVTRLLGLVRPRIAVFGEKDYQQLLIVRRLSEDLSLGVEIVGAPIVREPDGLAMSSRNRYLSESERADALALQRALRSGREAIERGGRSAATAVENMSRVLSEPATVKSDYVELLHEPDLTPFDDDPIRGRVLLAVAAHVGETRLIDNCVVNIPPDGGQ
ncbi:MAG: pantoate--beta-alanine ligase [Gemmatimonadetes bacterium]|nr:pantoate--beta-alanine ligase [Gemmatimonadota bacterium]